MFPTLVRPNILPRFSEIAGRVFKHRQKKKKKTNGGKGSARDLYWVREEKL